MPTIHRLLPTLAACCAFILARAANGEPPQAASDDEDPPADNTGYLEAKNPKDDRFITSITRLTSCKIPHDIDIRQMTMRPPKYSTQHHEEGRVVMQLFIDSDRCVRKATILQSSGYRRLDKASLDFTMNIKFPPSMLSNIKTFDDGRPTFAFPMVWKLLDPVPQTPYDPTDRCANGGTCVDEAPPPAKPEDSGAPPEIGLLWMPGYYTNYPKTGYQWNDGQWAEPNPGHHWVAPHWEPFRSKWLFVGGRWDPNK